MLNNKKTFERLMALLRKIDPKFPLPKELYDYLWEAMTVKDCKKLEVLEMEGVVPKNSYYVVRGFVIVYGFDANKDKFVMRIYREHSIVAMNCFMEQRASKFTIVACKDSLVYSISDVHMQYIYQQMPGMKEMALKTALLYSEAKEQVRMDLLALEPETRVLKFYKLFKGLLPAKHSPVRDADIAGYLGLKLGTFRKWRASEVVSA